MSIFCVNLLFWFFQSDGRAAVLHGEVKRSNEKIQQCTSALSCPVPGTVWCHGSQWHHTGTYRRQYEHVCADCAAFNSSIGCKIKFFSSAKVQKVSGKSKNNIYYWIHPLFFILSINLWTFSSSAEHICLSRRRINPDDLFCLNSVCSVSQTR